MLKLRFAAVEDVIPLLSIALDYQPLYQVDGDKLVTEAELLAAIQAKHVIAIVDQYNYPVGIVYLYDFYQDLRANISLLIRPQYLKQAVKQELFKTVVTTAFTAYPVKLLLAEPYTTQSTAVKLLVKNKFKKVGTHNKYAKQNGVIVGKHLFELNRNYWNKGLEREKQNVKPKLEAAITKPADTAE